MGFENLFKKYPEELLKSHDIDINPRLLLLLNDSIYSYQGYKNNQGQQNILPEFNLKLELSLLIVKMNKMISKSVETC